MRTRPKRRGRSHPSRIAPAVPLLGCLLALLGLIAGIGLGPLGNGIAHTPSSTFSTVVSAASGSSSSGSNSGGLCPSAGPVILGVEWNCVAILNLTEVTVILASIGIIAYVFRDSDRAELPGDAADVPITTEELEAFREARRLGLPYVAPPGEEGSEDP